MYAHVYLYVCIHVCACVCTHIHVNVYTCVCMYMYCINRVFQVLYISKVSYMFIYIYIYIYIIYDVQLTQGACHNQEPQFRFLQQLVSNHVFQVSYTSQVSNMFIYIYIYIYIHTHTHSYIVLTLVERHSQEPQFRFLR